MQYVGGYVIFNDITARDIQRREMKSASSASAKASTPFVRWAHGLSQQTRSRTLTISPWNYG